MYRLGRWVADHAVMFVAVLVLLYIALPIFFVVMMSFNAPASRLSFTFDGFTWNNWLNPCEPAGMCEAGVGFAAVVPSMAYVMSFSVNVLRNAS